MSRPPADIAAAIARAPAAVRPRLAELRTLILDTAAATDGVGPLAETLKWGEPAFLPRRPRTGTTIRMNAIKGSDTAYALYVHCQTSLTEDIQALYPGVFRIDGTRALVFDAAIPVPRAELAHAIALALTYHRRKAAQA